MSSEASEVSTSRKSPSAVRPYTMPCTEPSRLKLRAAGRPGPEKRTYLTVSAVELSMLNSIQRE